MRSRIFASVACLCTMVLGGNISAETPRQASSPTWITICKSQSNDRKTSSFDLQVPSGIDFKVIDAIANTLSDRGIDIGRLITRHNIVLEFSTASFMIMRIDGDDLTVAPGSDFPFDATRALTKGLNGLGIHDTTIADPDKLLHRRFSHGDPFFPEFAYDLRGQSASQSGNPFGP
ncbi:hypothetical protein [Allorhodopirellula solitaria]|uniref:Beta-hexosaminidase bacterial type N-terminal domain-containing protein n=1 Tax=Allorhodopirellula solitaria TaxID=2527987 RepID=A0A5C5X1B2_9BACT|nr:hypothetical protein [Allorhodopirellula solitaria]TWT56081.1 hypothetical protein CA85_45540 [Allorhodopirellula solitaria]